MAFITFDDSGLKRFERDLKRFAREAIPFANRAALNTGAFQGAREYKKEINKRLTLRNRFTLGGVRVQKATQRAIVSQRAVVGHLQRFMVDQEFGATKRAGGKHGVEQPTRSASGEGRGTTPRKRLPRKPNKARNIRIPGGRRRGTSRKQRNLIAVRMAAKSGRKFVFLDLQGAEGIYKVMGGKRNPKPEMIVDLSKKSVRIPATPTLGPAMTSIRQRMPGIYKSEIKKQLVRRRLFVR